jgi:hypothetical protein
MLFGLSDVQLHAVMLALAPLDPSKRAVAMERIAARLRLDGVRHPTDVDVELAVRGALGGGRHCRMPYFDNRRL